MATWWQQQEVLQLLLVMVKVLLANLHLLVLLLLVLDQASLGRVNEDEKYQYSMTLTIGHVNDYFGIDYCGKDCNENYYLPDTAGAPPGAPGAPGAVPGQADTCISENVIIKTLRH